jgi:hypothetical protein
MFLVPKSSTPSFLPDRDRAAFYSTQEAKPTTQTSLSRTKKVLICLARELLDELEQAHSLQHGRPVDTICDEIQDVVQHLRVRNLQ